MADEPILTDSPLASVNDVFHPKLVTSRPLNPSAEQKYYIRKILDYACSDSAFSKRAFDAIEFVLFNGFPAAFPPIPPPIITALSPPSVKLGQPSFTLHVIGANFDATSQIIWNGSPEPTTLISSNEVTTGVDMSTAQVADDIPVVIKMGAIISNSILFKLLPA